MATEESKDPASLPKVDTNAANDVDSEARGGATSTNTDLPSGLRGFKKLSALYGPKTKPAETSQKPSEN